MKNERRLQLFGLSIAGIAVFLCIEWYHWRLLLIIWLFLFSNNLYTYLDINKKDYENTKEQQKKE